jgi:glycosyltransferase involved in cell wall biosynthesis
MGTSIQQTLALRVLVVTPRFLPDTGGVERHVYETASRLANHAAQMTVLTTDRTRRRPPREHVDGIEIRRVHAWPEGRDYYIAPAIYGAVANAECDIVHVQSWHTPVAPLAMLAAYRAGIPYVVTPHGRGFANPVRLRFRPLQRRLLRPLLSRAEVVITIARFEREALLTESRLDPERVVVIPNGADLLPPATARRDSERCLIVSVGRLERFKGHHRILQALPHVLRSRPDAELVIVGDGPYEHELHAMATRLGVADRVRIEYFSMAERARLAELLSTARLLVLLSEYETQPIAALEAAAVGTPVLVANVAGMREFAADGLGRAVPLRATPPEIAAAALEQIANPILPPPGFALPTWDGCAQALLGIYLAHAKRGSLTPAARVGGAQDA